ncbi:MAG: hypothetical protein ACRESI_01525, partial [Gammaproteobacteria bacterium]
HGQTTITTTKEANGNTVQTASGNGFHMGETAEVSVDSHGGNGQENSQQGAGSLIATTKSQGAGTGNTVATQAATVSASAGGPNVSNVGSGDGSASNPTQTQYDTSIEQSGFKSPADAARAMGEKNEDSSVKNHQEYQAGIVKVGKGNYGYVTPITGAPGATVVNIRGYSDAIYARYGDAYIAFAHTHFDSNENFSPYDVVSASHFPLYLYNTNRETRLLNRELINSAVRGEPGAGYENRLRSYMNDNSGMPGECVYGCH